MDRVLENRISLEHLLVKTHLEAEFAWKLGASEEQMKGVLIDIRHAQWRWDFAAASHGAAFHAPVETLRIIGTGIIKAQEARLKIAAVVFELGHKGNIPLADVSTKSKAQAYIGWDMDNLNQQKDKFLEELLPEWRKATKKREDAMLQYELKTNAVSFK